MNFQSVVTITGLAGWMTIAAAAPETSSQSGLKAPEKSLAALIEDLSDEKFRVRENASREIWKTGESALPALLEIAAGEDPEQAYRARDLIRKIQLHITPETDPAVMSLVERYAKASPNEKMTLFDQMHKKRAWRQLLKLYASETNPELQSRLLRSVDGVAVIAARECLLDDDAATAREFLEMAPADAPGLLALADFHRSQGSLEAELKRAKTLKGVKADAWQLALYRASGNLEAARDAASAAGEISISVTLSALLGDPLPWLQHHQTGGATLKSYTELAIRRWQGKALRAADLEPLVHSANSRDRDPRGNAASGLFLLGEARLAEKAYAAHSPIAAFSYFESLERIPEALKAIGLDPENPDYAAWVEKRVTRLSKGDDADQTDESVDARDLVVLADFMERRGLHRPCADAFLKPLAALGEKDADLLTRFLGQLFGGNVTLGREYLGAPQVAKQAALAWAGDDAQRWTQVLDIAFGGQDEVVALWDWLAELQPQSSRAERLDGMLALCGMGRDPLRLREKWLTLGWAAVQQVPEEKRKPLLDQMAFMVAQSPDVPTSLKLWDQLDESGRDGISWRTHILDLSAAERWDEAAEFFLKQTDRVAKIRLAPQPSLYACAAACLRKAGRADEATALDSLVEKLALGNDALEIANSYAYGHDYQRSADWRARAVRQSDPASENFADALQFHTEMLVQQGDWRQVAAISEVRAQMMAAVDSESLVVPPLLSLRLRLQSDLGRALVMLKTDRAGSLAMLGNCYQMFPCDGSLADDFFPALRKAGLIKEHDEWFRESWERMTAVIRQFPGSDNTYNTAAWIASRARQNLDPAEKLLQKALAANPEQPAYLDTMAEIQFAKGNREKALEWSQQAVNFMPLDVMLRLQHERFRSGPLPR